MKESGEMYLETILILKNKNSSVRAVDISAEMKISKASVSRALARLKKENCIEIDGNGHIIFTDYGRKMAEKIYERHQVLTKVIMSMGVDEITASKDACKIEHHISDKTFNAIKDYIKNLD